MIDGPGSFISTKPREDTATVVVFKIISSVSKLSHAACCLWNLHDVKCDAVLLGRWCRVRGPHQGDPAWDLWYRSRRVGPLIGGILYGMKCHDIAEPSILSKPCTRIYVLHGSRCPVSGITAGPIHPGLCLPSGVAPISTRVGASSVTSSQGKACPFESLNALNACNSLDRLFCSNLSPLTRLKPTKQR